MVKVSNHRQPWINGEESQMVDVMFETLENGGSQRDACRKLSNKTGRTIGAIEYHWKKVRKENSDIMDRFHQVIAERMTRHTDPDDVKEEKQIKEMTKGAMRLHKAIQSVIDPNPKSIKLPKEVDRMIKIIKGDRFGKEKLKDFEWLAKHGAYDITNYIYNNKGNRIKYLRGIHFGYEVEMDRDEKIKAIHQELNKINPNEPGYMMARGMIVMMYHMGDILDHDVKSVIMSMNN